MNHYHTLYPLLEAAGLCDFAGLREVVEERLLPDAHGDLPKWLTVLDSLPLGTLPPRVEQDRLLLGDSVAPENLASVREALFALRPWRKGPIWIHGVHVDTEWRSDFKWNRAAPHLAPLEGRVVLDVGCGNGYHCFRAAAAGARLVVGVDPFILSVVQYLAMARSCTQDRVWVLPLGVEELPETGAFDTLFSMGLLYHRRSPFDHLLRLRDLVRPGGEMVLETLVVEGEEGRVLVPADRYAMMRNVWFIPTPATLVAWVRRAGFTRVRLVDVTATTVQEQRSTEWMPFDSLPDFLSGEDPARTVEGYPAPVRALVVAERPA